jgi:hypothetical protein
MKGEDATLLFGQEEIFMKTMQAPAGIFDVSFEGVHYKVIDGKVTLPDHARLGLYQFGFTDVEDETKEVLDEKESAANERVDSEAEEASIQDEVKPSKRGKKA